ncbi:hypothetical protein BJX66DRAFT_291259 [Aspergillus keveii]|uniref:Secreted protein n=1 Tax=Aspergillus keveii TaxID=714993 RepID=A0ABR4GNJ0_9EURO
MQVNKGLNAFRLLSLLSLTHKARLPLHACCKKPFFFSRSFRLLAGIISQSASRLPSDPFASVCLVLSSPTLLLSNVPSCKPEQKKACVIRRIFQQGLIHLSG